MKTATFIKKLKNFTGDARLYKLSEPLKEEVYEWSEDQNPKGHDYVVVSATVAMFSGPETYIFGADKDGEVTAWAELPGSFRGSLDHVTALNRAGYKIVE